MRKFIKSITSLCLVFLLGFLVACKTEKMEMTEKLTLASTMIGEVEFENSDKTKLEFEDKEWIVSGEVESMSAAQKSAFGVDTVTHVVVFKFEFDKERTIDYFKIQGDTTKVYSTDKNEENYVGSITELLDSESSEDAFCYLVLSANTKEYNLTARYTDDVENVIKIKIDASLVSASSEE